MTEPAYRIESVDKALRLLHMFREKPRWTVSEVSEALGVVPSTAHRLLAMLQWHDFAHQEPGSKAYVAGRALMVIGLPRSASSPCATWPAPTSRRCPASSGRRCT